MSGICGIISLDGSEPSVAQIEAVIQSIERRGPDGSHHWRNGPAALGHTLLATTPESLLEVLPLTDLASGCTITADVRLDNREELIAALGLAEEPRTIGDGELILCSYLRWREDCPTHLLGDFAFAIWDPSIGRLFGARDHMGMRQLIYHHSPGSLFVFATEPGAIVTSDNMARKINEGRIADFLTDLEGLGLTSTFFEEVFRLPPAHSFTVDDRGLLIRRYWELAPGPELKLGSDDEYAKAFLNVFTEAVRARLRSPGPVGSMLSGGIDSSSVCAVASTLLETEGHGPLLTFSAVGPDPDTCIETRTIRTAMRTAGLAPLSVNYAHLNDYTDDLVRLAKKTAEPFDGHMNMVRAVYLAASREQVKVMLDGVGGDVVLAPRGYVTWLLRRGRLGRALRETVGEKRFWGQWWPIRRSLSRAIWRAYAPRPVRNFQRRIRWRLTDRKRDPRLISSTFALRTNLAARRARARALVPPDDLEPGHRAASITSNDLVAGRERYDRIASALAIEPRDPFMDLRVIHFCLSLPWPQYQADGWPKVILRRAMRGKLSDAVLWRLGKTHLGWAFTSALFSQSSALKPDHSSFRTNLAAYIDVESAWNAQNSAKDSERFEEWTDLVYLHYWLEFAAARR